MIKHSYGYISRFSPVRCVMEGYLQGTNLLNWRGTNKDPKHRTVTHLPKIKSFCVWYCEMKYICLRTYPCQSRVKMVLNTLPHEHKNTTSNYVTFMLHSFLLFV